jgi:hypothetical protein
VITTSQAKQNKYFYYPSKMKKAPVETGAIQNPKPLNIVKVIPFLIYQNIFLFFLIKKMLPPI